MTMASTHQLESIYSRLKQHEKSLAAIGTGRMPTDHDIVSELLTDTRSMAFDIETALTKRSINPNEVYVPALPGTISVRALIEQRQHFRKAYQSAMTSSTVNEEELTMLEGHCDQLDGSAQEKLEIMGAALMSSQ